MVAAREAAAAKPEARPEARRPSQDSAVIEGASQPSTDEEVRDMEGVEEAVVL